MATVKDFQVNNGLEVSTDASVGTVLTANDYTQSVGSPSVTPSVVFDFAKTQQLDSRIIFTRPSTASFVAANGLIAYANSNQPRFNYDSNGVCQGLLIEEGTTNIVINSSQVGNTSGWLLQSGISGSVTVNLNAATAPDGTVTASYIYNSLGGVDFKNTLQYIPSLANNTPYSFSVFLKNNNMNEMLLSTYDSIDNITALNVFYNFSTNTITTGLNSSNVAILVNPTITPYANNWVRLGYTIVFTSGPTRPFPQWKIDLGNQASVYTLNTGYYVWGAQVEQKNKPSTYIPTGAAAVTRAFDTAYITDISATRKDFSSWYNPAQGTFKVEWNVLLTGPTANSAAAAAYYGYPGPMVVWLADLAGGNVASHMFYVDAANTKNIEGEAFNNTSTTISIYTPTGITSGVFVKTAFTYSNTSYTFIANTNTTIYGAVPVGNTISTVGRMDIGRSRSNWLNGHIKSIRYWPVALSNTDLYGITL
jgi:hypothetical protein